MLGQGVDPWVAPERAEVVTEVVTAVETVEVAKAEARVVVVKEEEVKAVVVMVAVARAAAAAEARAAEARVVVVMGGDTGGILKQGSGNRHCCESELQAVGEERRWWAVVSGISSDGSSET